MSRGDLTQSGGPKSINKRGKDGQTKEKETQQSPANPGQQLPDNPPGVVFNFGALCFYGSSPPTGTISTAR
ncbi:hypothetical protein [Flintibacter muris]|uniref:hypothetical protein n=1 Tax=Flintibacter muris TaxID=2941327 RepID=UPI0020403AF9|nr:hypothetical protein [Flintibacter muris]